MKNKNVPSDFFSFRPPLSWELSSVCFVPGPIHLRAYLAFLITEKAGNDRLKYVMAFTYNSIFYAYVINYLPGSSRRLPSPSREVELNG
ncbi:Hypothetical protein NTJ_11195 [Nesidiocoris tenuis]|uniref:Uncharacterized protein n=1 Tax=Nesidiocoris tenuis TaxID=355587 RepID=A0ABN7B1T8_9HEMI|nr:Hypothetical protein NTJ_11195 [Nesidiocoris tenuis]